MSNLFVVFTPFQLFIAQQLVHQEQLKDCILIEAYVAGNPHFIEIYDMMEMEGMWKKKYIIPDFAQWDGLRTTSIMDEVKTYKMYRKIWNLIKSNNVGTLYLGEMQNNAIRFTDIVFHHKGIKIVFFEEGTAHYILRPYKKETRWMKFREFIRDLVEYLPLYHVRFAKWRYVLCRPFEGELPMDVRYSVIPGHYNKPFDKQLYPSLVISKKLEAYMAESICDTDKKRVMFMTDPLAEVIGSEFMECYFDTIKECFDSISKDTEVYIKYHPRDPKKSRDRVMEIGKACGIDCKVMSERVNIPAEYYLQKFKFDSIFVFNASTYFYDGYLFPKCNFVKLLPKLYVRVKAAGLSEDKLKWFDAFLKK